MAIKKLKGLEGWIKDPGLLQKMVEVREKSKSLEAITNSLSTQSAKRYNWLEWDGHEMVGKFISLPPREDIPENINEQLIVELYSK